MEDDKPISLNDQLSAMLLIINGLIQTHPDRDQLERVIFTGIASMQAAGAMDGFVLPDGVREGVRRFLNVPKLDA